MGSPLRPIEPAELAIIVANARTVLGNRPKVAGMFGAIVHLDDENKRMRAALEHLRAYVEDRKKYHPGMPEDPVKFAALVALPETESVSALINVLVNLKP